MIWGCVGLKIHNFLLSQYKEKPQLNLQKSNENRMTVLVMKNVETYPQNLI